MVTSESSMATIARFMVGLVILAAIWMYPDKIGAAAAATFKAAVHIVSAAGERIQIPGEDDVSARTSKTVAAPKS